MSQYPNLRVPTLTTKAELALDISRDTSKDLSWLHTLPVTKNHRGMWLVDGQVYMSVRGHLHRRSHRHQAG